MSPPLSPAEVLACIIGANPKFAGTKKDPSLFARGFDLKP